MACENSTYSPPAPAPTPAPVPAPAPAPAPPTHELIASFAAEPGEAWQLSAAEGARCAIVEDHGDGWTEVRADGATGAVPSAYLKPLDDAPAAGAPAVAAPEPAPAATRARRASTHRMEHAFDVAPGEEAWQVSVAQGEELVVVNDNGDGWLDVEVRGAARARRGGAGGGQPRARVNDDIAPPRLVVQVAHDRTRKGSVPTAYCRALQD